MHRHGKGAPKHPDVGQPQVMSSPLRNVTHCVDTELPCLLHAVPLGACWPRVTSATRSSVQGPGWGRCRSHRKLGSRGASRGLRWGRLFIARIYVIRADVARPQPGKPSSVSGAGGGFEMRMRRAVVLQLRSPPNLRFPALQERSGPARLALTWSGRGGGGRWDGQHFGPASPPPSPPRPAAPPPPARPRRRRLPRTAAASKMPGQRWGGCRSPLVRGKGAPRSRRGALRAKRMGGFGPALGFLGVLVGFMALRHPVVGRVAPCFRAGPFPPESSRCLF